eukprot:UN30538
MPADHIIVMSYDDAAGSTENPYRNKLYNHPDYKDKTKPMVDVYEGCKIDYRGKDVTVANFKKVLLGEGGILKRKKVLKSTDKDNVFINFVDHGGDGIIAFPTEEMHASDLITTLESMNTKNMYNKLVFYMEACNSGSMFENKLKDSLNIYAITAANAKESSWGTYCPPHDDIVKGKHMKTCLGDLFSVNWMEETDNYNQNNNSTNPNTILTLKEQFVDVQKATNKSHVCKFGDMSFTDDNINDYEGDKDNFSKNSMRRKSNPDNSEKKEKSIIRKNRSAVDSRDIPLHLKYHNYVTTEFNTLEREENYQKLMKELQQRHSTMNFLLV